MFQFTPALRRATLCEYLTDLLHKFQYTPALRRATGMTIFGGNLNAFQFTPALRRATKRKRKSQTEKRFNSRPPCDGRLRFFNPSALRCMFQFTPALRRATSWPLPSFRVVLVSIHARLATGDEVRAVLEYVEEFQFTPALRRATATDGQEARMSRFQFTPALRRATATICSIIAVIKHLHAS